MTEQKNIDERQWQLLILLLKEIAIQKFSTGYQTIIAEKSGFQKQHINRFFSLKYSPSLKNFLKISKAIEVNFFFEDKESVSDLNLGTAYSS